GTTAGGARRRCRAPPDRAGAAGRRRAAGRRPGVGLAGRDRTRHRAGGPLLDADHRRRAGGPAHVRGPGAAGAPQGRGL
ncbi:MAG: hypothetical protein AVDCRST_MAG41-1350, partial [uncultured Corynebacteriales bacterium]